MFFCTITVRHFYFSASGFLVLIALWNIVGRYKLASESSHSKNEKKGKKRANSGSRDKDKTTRRSKVASASTSNSFLMDDSEGEAGPSGAVGINGAVDFCELHGLHGDYALDDADGPELFANIDMFPPHAFSSSPLKKGVMTRSAWNLSNKGAKSPKQSWSPNNPLSKVAGSLGKASATATKASSAPSTATKASATATGTKASANATKTTLASTSKGSASTSKASASASKASPTTSKASDNSKAAASTSKQGGSSANTDGASASGSAGPSSLCSTAAFYKLKFFPCKHDPKKSTNSGVEHSSSKGEHFVSLLL